MAAISQKVPDAPSQSVADKKTCDKMAFVTQFAVAAHPLARPLNCREKLFKFDSKTGMPCHPLQDKAKALPRSISTTDYISMARLGSLLSICSGNRPSDDSD